MTPLLPLSRTFGRTALAAVIPALLLVAGLPLAAHDPNETPGP